MTPQLSAAVLAARAQNQSAGSADASQKRPAQVSFPPGTKGSPSLVPAPTANGAAAPGRAPDGLLSIKLPHDATKAADAMSSPGSTAASATTTAPHDFSANTSPDNDGPNSPETNQQPPATQPKTGPAEQPALKKSPGSDEDQLLQESIRSAAASGSEDEAPPNVTTTTTTTTKPPTDKQPASTEVPDSQDEADKMDVDGPENQQSKDSIDVKPTPPLLTPQPSAVPVERAVTRVSSGAMRLKSVNEIVGATPRSAVDRTTPKDLDQLTPSASAPESPSSRTKSRKDRKGQVSTVLFGKQPKRVEDKAMAASQKEQFHPFDDYYTPLFIQNFTGATNWMQPIEKILFHANKTIGTSDANLAILDNQACKVLRRVYHLQQHDKWSLRQPKRCPEPTRPTSQWDVVLQEMKWMRTDFREERKWKMTVARNLANACAEWHESSAEERLALQVTARIPPKVAPAEDVQMDGAEDATADNHPTPDLEPSGDADSPLHDDISEVFVETVAPSAIFSLQDDDVVFGLRRTQAADQLLEELPLYGAPLKVPYTDLTNPEFDPDAHWRRPALPLSKYVEGEMKVTAKAPPRKRGRFDYRNEDSDDEGDNTFVADQVVNHARTLSSTSNVALFNPESKPIRDRLHAGHQFRPPSEHPMPMQSFYECRSASQWTVAEDDELRGLVREYSYNWSLISSILSTRSSFISGPERRTPWECFERWINLEGLPADMQKTQYFKAYNSRIESAQRVIAQQNQIAAQQANAAGNNLPPLRRRPSIPVRVERRRNQKHLTLIDAMRKLAKKRETAQQKQQQNASQNAVKKAAEPVARPTKTPRDYSLLRHERDQALAEKVAQYAARQEAQRRAAIQARQNQAAQMAGAAQGAQSNQGAPQGAPNGQPQAAAQRQEVPSHMVAAAAAAAAGQRPRMPSQGGINGAPGATSSLPSQMSPAMVAAAAQMKGIPAAQIQAALQAQAAQAQAHAQAQAQAQQHRMPMPNQQPDANLMLRAQQISNQQRAAVQIQQQQQVHHQQPQQPRPNSAAQNGAQGSPPMRNGMNGMAQQTFINNAQAMMAAYNANNANNANHNGVTPNGMHMQNGVPNGSPGPRIPTQLPPNIAAQLSQLEAQFRAKNPNLTPEQSRQLATEHLTRAMMAQRQSALNAAAGVTGQPGLANSIAATTSPHQYAALLRQQQQQQAAAAAAAQKQQQAQQNGQGQAQQAQQRATSSAAGSPVPPAAHQRQSSGSATPSSGK